MGPAPAILIVDDDRDIRETLAEVLQEEGFASLGAANGREALEILDRAARAPCLILLDLTMPVMDGFEFLEQRRRHPVAATVPVLVLTAGESSQTRALPAPVLRKPVKVPDLLKLVRQTC